MDNKLETSIGVIELKRAKVKQIKSIVKDVSDSIGSGVKLFKTPINDDEIVEVVSKFALEQWGTFEKHILSLTDTDSEKFDELDIVEAGELIKSLVEYNGVKGTLIKSFFQNLKLVQEEKIQTNFIQDIPKSQ